MSVGSVRDRREPPWRDLPTLLTADEVAAALRTSRTAIYAMLARGLLPGVVRIGRRVLFDRVELLQWLAERRALSPLKEQLR